MSSGRAYQLAQLNGLDQWLISNNLNFIQLIKKAIWSSLTLRNNTNQNTGMNSPGEELISKDLIGHLVDIDSQSDRFNSEEALLHRDFIIGTDFISNFILLNKLIDEINNARNGITHDCP